MNMLSPSVTELICTRISHDLIGNIGAVSNAVELLEEGDMDFLDDIRSILKTSSQVLAARLKFFRMAFGAVNANIEDKNLVVKTTEDYLKTIGNQNFPIILEAGSFSAAFAKAFMLSAMILADMVIKGGKIMIYEESGRLCAKLSASSRIAGQKAAAVADILAGSGEERSAQYAPAFYLRSLMPAAPVQINLADEENFSFVIG